MSCTYEPESISFPCILEVINEVRTGSVDIGTVRKALKQVDSGLALFGSPEATPMPLSEDVDQLVDMLEENIKDDVSQSSGIWLTILIAILRELLKNM